MLKNLKYSKQRHLFCSLCFALMFFDFFGQHTYGTGLSLEGKTEKELQVLLKEANEDIKKDPSNNENYFSRIIIKTQLGDTDFVIKECNLLIKKDPTYWKAYLHRGYLEALKGNLDNAFLDIDKVIEFQPENALAYNNKGYIFFLSKNYNEALRFYELAISKDSLYAEAYINIMDALYVLQDNEKLDKIANKLVNTFSTNPKAYIHRAEFYSSQGKYTMALNDYNQAVALGGGKFGNYWIEKIKFIDDVMQDDNKAIEECNKAISADPKNFLVYYMRSRPELDLHLYRKVVADCSSAIKLNPNDNPSYVMRGMAYTFLAISDSAFYDFDKAILLLPKEEEAYMQKTISYMEQQDYAKALITIDTYLKNDPALKFANIYPPASIFLQRAGINLTLKKYDDAIKDLNKTIQYAPNNSKAWLTLGEIYLLQNNNSLACEALITAEKLGEMKAKTKRIFNCH